MRIPIVPCAILFDLRNDGDKDWGRFSPYRDLGYAAAADAQTAPAIGAVGAARGAMTATGPGGIGMAAAQLASGCTVMALAAVNAAGSAHIGDTRHFWAAPFEEHDEFGGLGFPHPWPEDAKEPRTKAGQRVATANTTLAAVITDAALTAAQATRVAVAAHDGFARALYPVHTPADGDIAFAVSTGRHPMDEEALLDLGVVAGNVTARAIARGVYEANGEARS